MAAAFALGAQAAVASSENEERLAALLAVMQADLARPDTPGRTARLLESASLLPLMLREAQAHPSAVSAARALHGALRRGDRGMVATVVRRLARGHPYTPPVWSGSVDQALALGAAIHRAACAGCHDHPRPGALLPAEDLFALACREPDATFAARLDLGVKGQADTGFRNPFSRAERAALALWYRKGRACPP